MQQTESKKKLWLVTAQRLFLIKDTVKMLVRSWTVPFGECLAFCFVFQIKCRDSNAKKKKILKKVLQNLLQFVVSSPSKGAETILTLVHDVGSGNGKRKG